MGENITKNNDAVKAGLIGAISTLILVVGGLLIWRPIHNVPSYVLNTEQFDADKATALDSVTCTHIEILRDLEDSGILLTPGEYTSQISSFYSILIAVLVGLFVIFSLLSYFYIKGTSEREIREAVASIKREQEDIIPDKIRDIVRDSKAFEEKMMEYVRSLKTDELPDKQDVAQLREDLDKLNNNIDALFGLYGEIQEKIDNDNSLEIE